jgi:threonine/homoserine/homoserine lactone efflux protein
VATTGLVLVAVIGPYVLLASRARIMFRNQRAMKLLNRAAASILALTAGYVALGI